MKKIVTLLSITGLLFVGCGGGSSSKSPEEICHDRGIAYNELKKHVKGRLKAPSTAIFDENPSAWNPKSENCEHRLGAFVESQNSFGGMVKTYFTGEIVYDMEDKIWRLEYLRFN